MAKPKLALIPSTVGGSVYSVLPSNGDGDFDFSRASAATRINAQGLIETVAVGDNRLNYPLLDGTVQTCPHLLLEGQRTNLVTYSEAFDNASWTKNGVLVTSNAVISPDGYTNADAIVDTATNAEHNISRPTNIAVTASSPITQSVFLKSGTQPFAMLRNFGVGSQQYFCVVVNLNTGTITKTQAGTSTSNTSATITDYGNGWYRVTATATFATGTLNNPILHLVNSATPTIGTYGEVTYLGNGTNSIFAWGFQLENASSYATSYIPTLSAATTRIAEVCNGSGNASTFNDSEGVLMFGGYIPNDGNEKIIQLSNNTSNAGVIKIFPRAGGTTIRFQIVASGTSTVIVELPLASDNFYKLALKYKTNDVGIWSNGFELYTDTSATIPTGLNKLDFNSDAGIDNFYGKTKQLQYFDSALTDSELETLTSWMSFSDMAIDLNYTIQ